MQTIWPRRDAEFRRLAEALERHASPLPGLPDQRSRDTLAMQFVASLRRQEYTRLLLARPVDPRRADPHSALFDPERAAVFHIRNGDDDEAAWLVFLMVLFGNAGAHGWRRLSDVYGMLGTGRWSWAATSADTAAFRAWLVANHGGVGGRFGNHRKYESLGAPGANGTGAAVAGYVAWIGGGHRARFARAVREVGNDPHRIFDALYHDMSVPRFGRLARFDYLALIGRFGLAPIVPGSAYLDGATGPTRGARLLFDGRTDGPTGRAELQRRIDVLDADLGVGMQAMEDALCNWQKSPRGFVHFKG